MILEISSSKTIGDIRKEFSDCYPFLCIEFFSEPHRVGETTSNENRLPHSKLLSEIFKQHKPGELEIHSRKKTGIVEQEFQKIFGLNVQIFRMQGKNWIQTAGTDELTLDEQNEIGRNATLDSILDRDLPINNEKSL